MNHPLTPVQSDEISVLYEIASKLNLASSAVEWLEAVSTYARQRGASAGYLVSINADDGGDLIHSEVVASWNDGDFPNARAGDQLIFPRYWGENHNWHVAPHQVVLVEDVATSPLLDDKLRDDFTLIHAGAVVLLPQVTKGRWINLLGFMWCEPYHFDQRDRRIFTTSMRLSASVIERLRLTEQERQRAQRAEQISRINVTLSQARDENEILEAVTRYAGEYGVCSTVLMYLHTDADGNLAEITYIAEHGSPPIRAAVGHRRRLLRVETKLLMPGGSPTSEPICFEDFQTDPRFTESYRKDMMSRGLRSSVVLPLRNAGAWQALIVAYWAEPHALSEDEKVVYAAIIPTAASVVARHRAYLETQASEKAATILYQLAENINAATTHQETLEAVARLMPDCQGVYLNLWENLDYDRAAYIEIAAAASVVEDLGQRIGQRFTKDEFPFVVASRDERLVVVEDTSSDKRLDETTRRNYEALGTRAYMRVPFQRDGQLMGAVFFKYTQPRIFTEHERRMALGIADLVMAAVERIRLLQETAAAGEAQRLALDAEQQAREDLRLLYEVSETVNAALTFADIIKAITPLAHQIEKVHLILWEHLDYRKASYFEIAAGINDRGETPPAVGKRYDESQFPISKHMSKLRQLAIEDIHDHPLVDPVTRDGWAADNIGALLMVSLMQDERWYGVLSFESQTPRRYSERDRRLTLAISDLVLSAVIRIQAQQELAAAAQAQSQAFLAEQEAREEMALLYLMSKAINQASTLNDVAEAISRLFENPLGVAIWAWDNYDRSTADYAEILAATDPLLPAGMRLKAADILESAGLPPGEAIIVDDTHDPQWANNITVSVARQYGFRSVTYTNLAQAEQVIGVFTTGSRVPHRYTPRETRLISAVTDLTAAALERFRLRDQTERARQRAEILAHLNSAISRAKNENEIIDVIARYVQGLGAYFAGLNYATNEEWDTHLQSDVVVTWRDGVITNYRELGYQPERLFKYGVADLWLPHPYSVLYIENIETEPRLSQSQREGIMAAFRTRALVILPLFTGGVFQGLMNIAWAQPRVFDEQERYVFERLLQTVPAVVATRRALLAEQTIREETTMLYQVSKAINQATVMTDVLEETKRLFPDPVDVAIFAWEHYDRTRATYLEVITSTDGNLPAGMRLPVDVVVGAVTIDPTELVVANDVNSPAWANNRLTDSARMFGLHSIAFANLVHGQRVQGLFTIGSYAPYHFNAQEERLVAALTDLISAALERFRSQQAEEEARQEREELFQASQAINAATSFQEILDAVKHIGFDEGDFYLYTFENFDFRGATYIETVATGQERFMNEGMRIPLDQLPFLREHPRPGTWAYEDVPNHPELDPVTKATMLKQGVMSNLRFGLTWHNRILGAFGIDHGTPRIYTAREKRMMTALGELVSAAVERIRLQRETHAARERAERLAEQAQQLAALEERTRLARELHDSVSQALYGIGLGAQTARRFLDTDPALVRESVEYVLGLAEAGLAEMRALIFELRPESLENEGLAVALAKQGASLQARHGIEVHLELCDEPLLPLAAKESLYRVAREALHNVIKHARASQLTLKMHCDGRQLHLDIIDNGVGFSTDQDFPGHLGLHSMRERIVQLQGTLTIESATTQGTHLAVVVPMQQDLTL